MLFTQPAGDDLYVYVFSVLALYTLLFAIFGKVYSRLLLALSVYVLIEYPSWELFTLVGVWFLIVSLVKGLMDHVK